MASYRTKLLLRDMIQSVNNWLYPPGGIAIEANLVPPPEGSGVINLPHSVIKEFFDQEIKSVMMQDAVVLLTRMSINDGSGKYLISESLKRKEFKFVLIPQDGGPTAILPHCDSARDYPYAVAALALLEMESKSQTLSDRVKKCRECQRFFIAKTDRGSQFCETMCRGRFKYKNKKTGT